MGKTVRTLDDLGREVGLTPRQLIKLRKLGMPGDTGAYDVDAVQAWRAARREEQRARQEEGPVGDRGADGDGEAPAADGVPKGGGELRRWTAEYRKFKAMREALTVQRMRGDVIERRIVERILQARAVEFRRALLGMARRVAPLLAGHETRRVQAILEDECQAILSTYHRAPRLPVATPLPDETEEEFDGGDGAS